MNNHLLLKLFLDNYVGILLMKYKKISIFKYTISLGSLRIINQKATVK